MTLQIPYSILITGGSGLIGQALIPALAKDGHQISVLTRRPEKYPKRAVRPHLFSSLDQISNDHAIDAVINLAGARIIGPRWTIERKQVLRDSRIALTRELVAWISRRRVPPEVLISGSASGFYGDHKSDILDENEPSGNDFGAEMCRDWEWEGNSASQFGTRVVTIRTGLVLSDRGGMLPPMARSFRFLLGMRIGKGNQWMSWIHMQDQVAAIVHLLTCPTSTGAYNLSSPNPVTNAEFSSILAQVLGRPCLFSAPESILRMGLGEAADLLLGGQRQLPRKLLQEGYEFQHPTLKEALTSLLVKG